MTTTTTTITSQSSSNYPYKFIVIQVLLGIVTLFVLIALIIVIWYRCFKNNNIQPVDIEPEPNEYPQPPVNTHVYSIIGPNVDRRPNPLYKSSDVKLSDNPLYTKNNIVETSI